MFLGESKDVVKENKISKYIIDNIEISSDSGRENSDEESFFSIYKKWHITMIKKQREASKRSPWKVLKSFWKRKRQKATICSWAK